MRPFHERVLQATAKQRQHLPTRRQLPGSAAKLAAGSTMAIASAGAPTFGRSRASSQVIASDAEVLNYALELEHLAYALFRDGAMQFTFGADPFGNSIDSYMALIGEHEAAHVVTLSELVADLGGDPVSEQSYNFGLADAASFLALAHTLKDTAVSAYAGVAAALEDPDLLSAVGTTVAVEARHASYVSLLAGELPFPNAFESPLARADVLEVTEPLIAGRNAATPAALPAPASSEATPADASPFAGSVDIVQYALTLKHLGNALYREAVATFDEQAFVHAGYQGSVREFIATIAEHEAAHVRTLSGIIGNLGEEPVMEASYDFVYTDLPSFLATAAAIENLGVDAYTGAVQSLIADDNLLITALAIHSIEARHAAFLNLLTGSVPFPNAFDSPRSPEEVIAIARPFVSVEDGTTQDATPAS